MTDDLVGFVLVFLHEFLGTREGDLVDVFVHLFAGHANPVVANGDGAGFLVEDDFHLELVQVGAHLAEGFEGFYFLGRVYRVGHQFTQKNLLV